MEILEPLFNMPAEVWHDTPYPVLNLNRDLDD